MGGKSSKPTANVDKFYMSAHYGVCQGPVDEVKEIKIKEKSAWHGILTGNATVDVSKENLFGGILKEGGVSGTIEVMFGDTTQKVSSWLAGKLGRSVDDAPGYRGMLSLVFRGSKRGFYWTASTPYLGSLWVRVARFPRTLDTTTARISRHEPGMPPDTGTGAAENDANPAHIIYEALTNTDWGLGVSPSDIDTAGFQAAAQVLYGEAFGVSVAWTQSSTVQEFINDLLGCIDGSVFTHPRTGKLTLRLTRDDYDRDSLPLITPDNAKLRNFSRKAWGETTNEMKVSWTNPVTESEETVYAQDLGNIALQGSVISDSKNYHMVRRPDLAQWLANRELRKAAAPLCVCEATVDRSMWGITPFQCVRLSWPEYGLDELVMRVVDVNYGKTGDSAIRLSLIEDIFSLPAVTFVAPPSGAWDDPDKPPQPISFGRIYPVPAYMAVQAGYALDSIAYPETLAALLVAAPAGGRSNDYTLEVQEPTPVGALEWVPVGEPRQFLGRGLLDAPLPRAEFSTIEPLLDVTGPAVEVNSFLLIGPDTAPVDSLEMALVTNVDLDSGAITLMRGVLDTVPQDWPTGTPAWVGTVDDFAPLPASLIDGQSMQVRALGESGGGEEAVPVTFTGTALARPTLPLRPANVKVNGVAFSDEGVLPTGTLSFTWSHRNRTLEDSVVTPWTSAGTVPEPGVSYQLNADAYDIAGALLEADWYSENVGSGEAFTLDLTGLEPPAGTAKLWFRLTAERDGEVSWQSFVARVNLLVGGG